MITFEPFRQWCILNDVSRKEVAAAIGTSLNTVNNIFNDKLTRTDKINAICGAFNLRVEQVLEYRKDSEEE